MTKSKFSKLPQYTVFNVEFIKINDKREMSYEL
jgi:hypothetical protein